MENKNGEDVPPKRCSEMTSSSAPNESDHNNTDLTLAMSLQEQEEWSDGDDPQTDQEEEADEDEEFDYEQYSTSQDVDDAELGFLEEEEEEESEDEIDPDEMSYEELMELGETIGDAEQRGLPADKISSCLRPITYPTGNRDQCVVCQTEYEEGETLVGLSCTHVYHAECITRWLRVKKTCPICTMEISPPTAAVEDVGKTKV